MNDPHLLCFSTSPGSSNAVEKAEPIDNKIEQAMVSEAGSGGLQL